jgi:hypothetical protein
MKLSTHKLLCTAWLCAFGLLAGSPTQNPRPCPIPSAEALPPTPPPFVPSPTERAAAANRQHSNEVARLAEREAYLELVKKLADTQGADATDLDRDDTSTVERRSKILSKACKDKSK